MRHRDLYVLVLLAVIAVSGVYATFAGQTPDEQGPDKRGSDNEELTVFPHELHLEYDMLCTECHAGAEEQDRATLPAAEVCVDCHDQPDPEWDTPELIVFFEERDAGEGQLYFSDSLDFADLKFSHGRHAEKGVQCADCHGEVARNKPIHGGEPDFKHACRDCHALTAAGTECSTCHDTYRSDLPPSSHAEPAFKRVHGREVSVFFRSLPEGTCFYCHQVNFCEQCHSENKPAWHNRPFFRRNHGERVRPSRMSLADAGCAFCHDKSGCNACHQRTEPRSHNITFKNRTHGLIARAERNSCRTCHMQSFCIHCHTTKEPLSHRGQFNRRQQLHCFSCHLPLAANSCAVCHRDTLGHFNLPKPSDAAHLAATPDTCRLCHTPRPHADNGLDCTICH